MNVFTIVKLFLVELPHSSSNIGLKSKQATFCVSSLEFHGPLQY